MLMRLAAASIMLAIAIPALAGTVSCTGHGVRPPIETLSAVELAFGDVEIGDAADRSFTITNTGGGTLVGSVRPGPACHADYSIIGGGGAYALTAGQVRTVTVRYMPTEEGEALCDIVTGP